MRTNIVVKNHIFSNVKSMGKRACLIILTVFTLNYYNRYIVKRMAKSKKSL